MREREPCGDPPGTTYTIDPDTLREEGAAAAAVERAAREGGDE